MQRKRIENKTKTKISYKAIKNGQKFISLKLT